MSSTAARNPDSGASNFRNLPPSLGMMSLIVARPLSTYRRVSEPSFMFSGLLFRFAAEPPFSRLEAVVGKRVGGGGGSSTNAVRSSASSLPGKSLWISGFGAGPA